MRCVFAVLIVLSLAARAEAGDKATAEAAFQQGKALMKAGRYAEACTAFEKSQASDPQLGTEYNLALCYQEAGRLASAWASYRELAQRDTNRGRRADSQRRAAALEPRLIKLLISVRAPVPGLQVTRNGVDVSGAVGIESPVDPGEYEIRAVAEGHAPWSLTVSARQEGGTVQVTVPELERLPDARPRVARTRSPMPPHADTPRHRSPRKRIGLFVGAGGVATVAGGLVLGGLALRTHDRAAERCGGDVHACTATGDELASATADEDRARTFGTVSTVAVGVGAAAVLAGTILYLTSPEGVRLTPSLTSDGVGLAAAGTF